MKTIIKSIIITAIFFSCQPSVKKENRLSDKFNFEQVLYTYYKSPDYGGLLPHYGSIIINESEIKILLNTNDESVEDKVKINRVTYDENKNEFDYRTNAGKFILEMNKDQIKSITHYTGSSMATFYEENKSIKNTINSKTQTYYEFDSKMLIDKELIDLAEELGSDYYKKYDFFYGVVSYVDKSFDSFKIKILKSNQDNIESLGYDITGMEWEVKMDKVKYLDNNEMCEICFSDFKKLMIKGRKLKFSMVEGIVGGGTAYNGIWSLTYAKEFKDD
jgi:hypothetical protein